jgi:predicted ATPase/Tfp pilus assembly protein PilF
LISAIGKQRMLLLFDNCHRKLSACARMAETLLRACPNLKMLVTSRQGLGIVGEKSYLVPSLSLPDGNRIVAPAPVRRSDAAQLFADRALAIDPEFTISTATASALARICHRLDGIPLALELAASALQSQPLEQIDSQIEACFQGLFGEKAEVIPRAQTLRAAIEWCFERLSAVEQAILCRLTVFRSGWTLEAAEAVCAGQGVTPSDVAEAMIALRNACLVIEEAFGNEVRFEMPNAVQEYGRDLLEGGESTEAYRQHMAYYLQLAQSHEILLDGPEAAAVMDSLEREQPNFRTALDWCHDDWACADLEGQLTDALRVFWERRAYPGEGQRLLARLEKEHQEHSPSRAGALMTAAETAMRQGDYESAQVRFEQALFLYREIEDHPKEAAILHHLGIIARERGDAVTAQARHERALALHKNLDDPIGEALHLHNLGNALRERGDYDGARQHYEQAYSRNWSAGNRIATAHNLNGLARVFLAQGDKESAHRLYSEALNIFQETQDAAWQAYNLREIVKFDLQPGLFWVENHR